MVGAALNRRPDLFRAAAFTNAFLDVTSAMSSDFASHYLTEHERAEWCDDFSAGSDAEANNAAAAAEQVKRYCPVTNARRATAVTNASRHCPSVLCAGTVEYENVPCQDAASFVVRARCADKGNNNVEGEGGNGR